MVIILCGKETVSEDGLDNIEVDENRQIFQRFLLEKKNQGFLLCLCSRNDEDVVWSVFESGKVPGMILGKEDFADWAINWEAKSQNVRSFVTKLWGLSPDSFIFIDDQPEICEEVRKGCPDVLTLQFPEEASNIPVFLRNIWPLGDVLDSNQGQFSSRTQHYHNNREREKVRQKAATFDDFIKDIQLKVTIQPATKDNYERIAQLMIRCNQLNFNKWSNEECSAESVSDLLDEGHKCLVVSAEDRFSDYKTVGVMLYVCREGRFLVKTFAMSCRALKLGIEYAMLNRLAEEAGSIEKLCFLFRSTHKNKLTSEFLEKLNFEQEGSEGEANVYSISTVVAKNAEVSIEDLEYQQVREIEVNETVRKENQFLQVIVDESIKKHNAAKARKETSLTLFVRQHPILTSESAIQYVQLLCEELGLSGKLKDPFVYSGVDSILAVYLASYVHKNYGINLKYTDIISLDYTPEKLAEDIYRQAASQNQFNHFLPHNKADSFPLSREQQRLWLHYKNPAESAKYNMSVSYRLQGNVDTRSLEKAFQQIVKEEDIFRMAFCGSVEPTQSIIPYEQRPFAWQILDRQGVSLSIVEKENKDTVEQVFNLEKDLLLRVHLFQIDKKNFVLTICVPHIIHDATSFALLIERLNDYYEIFCQSKTPLLQNNKKRYVDYADWQATQPSCQEEAKEYWEQQLTGGELPTLPILKQKAPSHLSGRLPFSVESSIVNRLNVVAETFQVTLYHTVLSLFAVLLSGYTKKEDILLLTPSIGRTHPETQDMIGFFVNLLFLRLSVKSSYRFAELLSKTRNTVLKSLKYENFPFAEMLALLDNSQGVLPVGFCFQNYKAVLPNFEGVSCERIFSDNNDLLYDASGQTRLGAITFYLREENKRFSGLVEYDKALFTKAAVQQLVEDFKQLLIVATTNVTANTTLDCVDLKQSFIVEKEKQLLRWAHGDAAQLSEKDSLMARFQQRVNDTPLAVAVCFKDREINYRELNQMSDQLSVYLQKQLSLNPGDRVAFCLPRDWVEAVTILAIVKARCTYVPIYENDPEKRVQYILRDTAAKGILVNNKESLVLDNDFKKLVVNEKLLDSNQLKTTATTAQDFAEEHDLAYIMYTSGSTGEPKGVMVKPLGILRLVQPSDQLTINSTHKIAQFANPAFDAATLEFWGALLNGATLVYPPTKDTLLDVDAFSQFLKEKAIDVLWLTAALLEKFAFMKPAVFQHLTYLLSGGDVLNPKAIKKIMSCEAGRPVHIINSYGPTECTTFTTLHEIKSVEDSQDSIPIGRPIPGTSVYVLDDQLKPVTVGVPGSLYVGGYGVAKGYLNQADQTRDRFVEVNIGGRKERLYNTGDRVYWLLDGTLAYVGRNDTYEIKT